MRSALAFVIAGIVLSLVIAGAAVYSGSRSWGEAVGTVVKAEAKRHNRKSGARSSPTRGTPMYELWVEYTYSVDGVTQTDRSVAYTKTDEQQDVQAAADKLPAGSSLPVFYDLDDPTASRLSAPQDSALGAILAVGFILPFFGLFAFLTRRNAINTLIASGGRPD